MSYNTDNQIQSKGYGRWKIYMHKDAGVDTPSIYGELLIDSSKYTIVKPQGRELIMIVPSGNVAFAINLDEATDPTPIASSALNDNPFNPRNIDRG